MSAPNPDPIAAPTAPITDIRKMTLDFDGWLADEVAAGRTSVSRQLSLVEDKKAEQAVITNQFWLADKTGIPLRTVISDWDKIRPGWADRLGFVGAQTNDVMFHARVKAQAEHERDENVMIYGTDGDTEEAVASRDASLYAAAWNAGATWQEDGEGGAVAFQKWQEGAKASPAYRAANASRYYNAFMAAYQEGADDSRAARGAAEGAFPILRELETKGRDISEAVPFFRSLTPAQRALAIRGMLELADKNPSETEQRGTWDQMAVAFGRTLSNLSDSASRGLDRTRLTSLQFEAGQDVPDGTDDEVISHFLTHINPRQPIFGEGNLTEERAAALNAAVKQRVDDLSIQSELIQLAQGEINPLRRKTWGEKMALGSAESLAAMAVIAIPVAGMAAMTYSYKNDAEEKLMAAGIPIEKAQNMALVIGPAQAALDRLQLGLLKKMPGLNGLLTKYSTKAALNFVGRAAATVGAEVGIELAQDQFVPAFVQDVASWWDAEVPGVKWDKVKEEAWTQAPDVLLAVLPLALVGSGAATFRDFHNFREIARDPERLRAAGFSASQAAAIQLAETDKEAAQMVREGWSARETPAPSEVYSTGEDDTPQQPPSISPIAAWTKQRDDLLSKEAAAEPHTPEKKAARAARKEFEENNPQPFDPENPFNGPGAGILPNQDAGFSSAISGGGWVLTGQRHENPSFGTILAVTNGHVTGWVPENQLIPEQRASLGITEAGAPSGEEFSADGNGVQGEPETGIGVSLIGTPDAENLLNRQAGIIALRRDDDGWNVLMKDGSRVQVGTIQAAHHMRELLIMDRNGEEATAAVELIDRMAAENTARGEGTIADILPRTQVATKDTAGNVTVETTTDKETTSAVSSVAALAGQMTTMGATRGAIEGSNRRLADATGKFIRHYEINRGQAPLAAIAHEWMEANYKAGTLSGKISGVEIMAAANQLAVLPAFNPDKIKDPGNKRLAESLRKLALDEDMTEDERRETVVELAVADYIGRFADGTKLRPGSIHAGLRAAALQAGRAGSPALAARALKSMTAMFALVRKFLGAMFDLARAIRKARDSGALKEGNEWDALMDKLTGTDAQKAHERGTLEAAGLTPNKDGTFSLKAETGSTPPGGLSEAEGEVHSVDAVLYRGENDGNGRKADDAAGGIHFTTESYYAKQYGDVRTARVVLRKALDFRALGKSFTGRELAQFLERNGVDLDSSFQAWAGEGTIRQHLDKNVAEDFEGDVQGLMDPAGHIIRDAGYDGFIFAEHGSMQEPSVVVFSEASILPAPPVNEKSAAAPGGLSEAEANERRNTLFAALDRGASYEEEPGREAAANVMEDFYPPHGWLAWDVSQKRWSKDQYFSGWHGSGGMKGEEGSFYATFTQDGETYVKLRISDHGVWSRKHQPPDFEVIVSSDWSPSEVAEALKEIYDWLAEQKSQSAPAPAVNEKSPAPAASRAAVTEKAAGYRETQLPDATLEGPATFSIRAFHGTPHKVDKFTTEKIGTGEGANVYGWGLYFAEERAVAAEYSIAHHSVSSPWRYDGGRFPAEVLQAVRTAIIDYNSAIYPADKLAVITANIDKPGRLEQMANDGARLLMEHGGDMNEVRRYSDNSFDVPAASVIDPGRLTKGNVYTVELLPDAEEFLDWDKPLSEQSEKVKAALSAFNPSWTGAEIYMDVATKNMRAHGEKSDHNKAAAGFMRQQGVPGIRYLDGNSRDGGSGTYNYVIFDEKLVKILEENGKPVDSGVQPAPAAPKTVTIRTFSKKGLMSKSTVTATRDTLASISNIRAQLRSLLDCITAK